MTILVIGHRGARGLLPELSIAGFSKALELGVDGIEFDVGITADRNVVVYHSYALNPDITRDQSGKWLDSDDLRICDLQLKDIREYDIGRIQPKSKYEQMFSQQVAVDGSRIPTLAEIVELVNQHNRNVTYCIEPKRSPVCPQATVELEVFAQTLIVEMQRLKIIDDSVVLSFDWSLLREIKKLEPNIKQWRLTSELDDHNTVSSHLKGAWTGGAVLSNYENSIPKMILDFGGDAWCSNYEALTPQRIEEAHRLGLKVYCWTVNERTDFARLIDAGVDGITTDYPDRLISFLNEYGARSITPAE